MQQTSLTPDPTTHPGWAIMMAMRAETRIETLERMLEEAKQEMEYWRSLIRNPK